MKNLLLKSVIVSCVALSVSAMEEDNLETTGQSLKFQINHESGSIEDAPGGDFISTFRESVQRVDKVYGISEQKIEGELALLDEALNQMQPDFFGYEGTKLYRTKLVGKIEKVKNKRESNLKLESFLQKILMEIDKATELVPVIRNVYVPVADFEKLTAKPFKEIELDFAYAGGTEGVENVGKSYFLLQIKSHLPMDLSNQLYPTLQNHHLHNKLSRAQKEMFNWSKIIYHVSTNTLTSLKTMEQMMLSLFVQNKAAEYKSIPVLLNEEVEAYNKKAEERILPRLEALYRMAKAIMAFEKEATSLKSLRQSAG